MHISCIILFIDSLIIFQIKCQWILTMTVTLGGKTIIAAPNNKI